jgi:hypothetical protein
MQQEFSKAEKKVEVAEKEKYEDKEANKLKSEYMNKSYSIEERENLVDLVKFYAEWLYSPVDEELENKLYFLGPIENKYFEDYFYEKLKDEYDAVDLDKKKKLEKLYGLRIMDNKSL